MANPQPEPFVRFSKELYDAILRSPMAATQQRIVLAVVRRTYGNYGRTEAEISLGLLRDMLGQDKSTIRRALHDLCEQGVVVVTRPAHFRQAQVLRLNKDYESWGRYSVDAVGRGATEGAPATVGREATEMVAEEPLPGGPSGHSLVGRAATIEDPGDSETRAETSPSCPPEPQPDDRFDEFWELYPNKESKQPARLKWRRLSERQRSLAIDVARQMHDLVAAGVQEAQFCPHPTTFMNQRRWEDWADGPPPRWRPSTTSMRGDDLRSLAAVARQMEDDHEDL